MIVLANLARPLAWLLIRQGASCGKRRERMMRLITLLDHRNQVKPILDPGEKVY